MKKNDKIRYDGHFYRVFSVLRDFICLESLETTENKFINVNRKKLEQSLVADSNSREGKKSIV